MGVINTNRPIVFLPVEIVNRELDYKLNLSRLFCNEGFNVIIGNPAFLRDELRFKNYKAVFLEKGFSPCPDYYNLLFQKGVYLYDMSDESMTIPSYKIRNKNVYGVVNFMRFIFFSGIMCMQEIIEGNKDERLIQKYKLIGVPAFDLSSRKYIEMHKKLKSKKTQDSYILVNTNFSFISGYSVGDHLEACAAISQETYEDILYTEVREKKYFPIFIEWVKNIVEAFSNETFVIRPHPIELQNVYEKLFGHYKNVYISKEGSVNQVISCAKMILHKDCSTALQGYLMGVPVISLGGPSLNYEYEQWTLAFSALPDSVEQAKKFISHILLHKKWDQEMKIEIDKRAQKVLDSHLCNIGSSTKELVKFIVNDANKLLQEHKPYKLIDSRTKLQKLKVFIRKFMPFYYKLPKVMRETFLKFNKQDLIRRLDLFESVDPLNIKFDVKKIYPNTFFITTRE